MTAQNMQFNPSDGLRNVAAYPTNPPSEAALRDAVQAGMDQLRDHINNVLTPKVTDKTGDTMTGPLTLSGDPTIALHAATKQYVDNKLVGAAWIAPTLLNSWVNYGAPYTNAGYVKDSSGFVHLRGVIKSGATGTGTILFNLPAGYRPTGTLSLATTGSSGSGGSYGQVSADANGDIKVWAGNNLSFSLDGITFRGEQ